MFFFVFTFYSDERKGILCALSLTIEKHRVMKIMITRGQKSTLAFITSTIYRPTTSDLAVVLHNLYCVSVVINGVSQTAMRSF